MARDTSAGWAYSYANRVEGRLHLSVYLPKFEDGDTDGSRVRISNGGRTVVAPATISRLEHGVFLDATFPAATLANGVWPVEISPEAGATFEPSNSRVCVSDPNPISLLVGPLTPTHIPAPRHTLPQRQRIAKSLGKKADVVLAPLGPERATKVRASLRSVARKVLSS